MWKDFEDKVANYIATELDDYDLTIKHLGETNSTVSDIEITLNQNGKKFYIEIKMPKAQTSQFVVELETNRFIYSNKNKFPENEFAKEIISELNDNFDFYSKVKQNAMEIPIPTSIALGWINYNMDNKKVKFIVSVDSENNEKIIPISKFNDFFDIKTILRRKKSGSSSIPKKYFDDFKKNLKKKINNNDYELFTKNNKLFLRTNHIFKKQDCYLISDMLEEGKKYFLSYKETNLYEVKVNSKTNNPNIIFEIERKNNIKNKDFSIQNIIDYLNELN